MTKEQFLKLQIGQYLTEKEDWYGRSDFQRVEQFDRMGRICLQPLDNMGRPSCIRPAYWIDYRDYDLQESMFRSDFLLKASVYGD